MAEATVMEQRSAQLIEAMWNDAGVGAAIQKKAKELWPDVKTNAEVFAPVMDPLMAQAESIKKEIADLRAEREEERTKAAETRQKQALEDSLNTARRKYQLTDEGFDQMVARMKDTGNYTDADAAAAWVVHANPPKQVKGPLWAPQDIDLFGSKNRDESFALLHRDPTAFMDAQLNEFVADPDKYVRETFGIAA